MNRFLIALVALSIAGAAFAQAKKPTAPKPQTKCAVTDEDLGSMGKPLEIAYKGKNDKYKGKKVLVCCGGCVGKVEKAQDKYFAKVFGK